VKKIAALFSLPLVIAGCATAMNWQPVGGSRSDGVVRLAFEYGMFQRPQLNESQAVALATQRCRVWGYSGAEAFGAATQQCTASNGYGCVRTVVTKEYQCTGAARPQ
jgi:hypothetical protein